jgi:predicted house-cleaning noncanonical NTP pyrophosphatase (MazG superfamily)
MPFVEAVKNPAPYQKAIGVELEQKVLPALQDESQKLVNVFGPELYQSVSQKVSQRFPEITRVLQAEALGLIEELSNEAESRLTDRSEKMIDRLKKRLVEEVPEFGDEEKTETIMENIELATTSAMDRFIQAHFQDHIHAVSNLQVRIETFPVPDHIAEMTDDRLQEHLTETLGAYVTNQFSKTMSPQMKDFLRGIETKQAQ